MTKRPELFWGLIASMFVANVMLLVINLPLVGLWVRLLRVPYRVLFPLIVVFCCIGVYALNPTPVDLLVLAAFGLLGVVLAALGFQAVPMILGFILGAPLEEYLRRAMTLARGDPLVFLERPIATAILAATALLLVGFALAALRRPRGHAAQTADTSHTSQTADTSRTA